MARILIESEGGIVQNVVSDEPVECIVIDRDTEGADDDELSVLDGESVVCKRLEAEEDELAVIRMFEDMDKAEGEEASLEL